MVPHCDAMAEMRSPEFLARWKTGPTFMATFLPQRSMSMAPSLFQWFIFSLVLSFAAAMAASHAFDPGTPYLRVFHLVALLGFLGHAGALWQMSIFYRRSWGTTIWSTIDGLIYGLVMAGVFGWLWPK